MKSVFKISFLLIVVSLFVVGCQNTPNLTEPQSMGGYTYSVSREMGDPVVYPVYAGQHIYVGELLVSNDADYLYITIDLIDPWVTVLSHIHISPDFAGIPKTNKGNPIPGQFAYNTPHDYVDGFTLPIELAPYGFEVGQQIYIAVHLEVWMEVNGGGSSVVIPGPYGASSVHSYNQGLRYDFTPVIARRSNPDVTLTFNTGASGGAYEYFYSLGFQTPEDHDLYDGPDAWLIVEFDYPILNMSGDDLRIIEDTWGLPYPNEVTKVWVSQDMVTWHYLGEADNRTPISQYHTIFQFELDDVGLEWAKYVKVQDVSVREDFAHLYPGQGATLDGYDVNAILAIHDYEDCDEPEYEGDETAWGGNVQVNPGQGGTQWWRYVNDYVIQGEVNGGPFDVSAVR